MTAGSGASAESPAPVIMLDEALRLSNKPPDGQVLNGAAAQRLQWPATFVFLSSGQGCTSTAVGSQVLLTAAHCVTDGAKAFVAMKDEQLTEVVCFIHPDYRKGKRSTADFALCRVSNKLPSLGVGYERINTDPSLLAKARSILLLGYGCQSSTQEADFKELYQGYARVKHGSRDRTTIATNVGAVLCRGDSGGGAYWIKDRKNVAGGRMIVGVNSQGNLREISTFSATSSEKFKSWASTWAADQNLLICGIYDVGENCRRDD